MGCARHECNLDLAGGQLRVNFCRGHRDLTTTGPTSTAERSVSSLSQPIYYALDGSRSDNTSPGANIGAIGCRGPDSRSVQALPRRLRRSIARALRRRIPGVIGAMHAEEFIRRVVSTFGS
jgi:hypothetical protein